jgi:hypothetical protein
MFTPHIATHYLYTTEFDLACAAFVVTQDLLVAAQGEIYPQMHSAALGPT